MEQNYTVQHESKEEALEYIKKTAEILNDLAENNDLESMPEKPLPPEGEYSINTVYEQLDIDTAFRCLNIAVSRLHGYIEEMESNGKVDELANVFLENDYYELTAKLRDFCSVYNSRVEPKLDAKIKAS